MLNQLTISKEFTETPGARYVTDGKYSGESFFREYLRPRFAEALAAREKLTVNLDGTHGYATSFLDEAFGGLAKEFGVRTVLENLIFKSDEEPFLVDEIKEYIQGAKKGVYSKI